MRNAQRKDIAELKKEQLTLTEQLRKKMNDKNSFLREKLKECEKSIRSQQPTDTAVRELNNLMRNHEKQESLLTVQLKELKMNVLSNENRKRTKQCRMDMDLITDKIHRNQEEQFTEIWVDAGAGPRRNFAGQLTVCS